MVDVYRRPRSSYWYFDISVDGKRSRCSTKRTKKSEAEAVAAAELQRRLNAVQFGEVPELTLRQALFDHYLPQQVKLASYDELVRHCHVLCGDREDVKGLADGGDTKLHLIGSTKLATYRAQRIAAGMSDRSVNLEIRCVSGAYNMVSEDYRVKHGVKFPIVTPKGKPRPLTPPEEAALLADLDPARPMVQKGVGYLIRPLAPESAQVILRQRVDNHDLAIMLLDTGARFGEIAKLTWAMVDTINFDHVRLIRTKVNNASILETTNRMRVLLRRRWEGRGNSQYVFPGWLEGKDDTHRTSTKAIRRAMHNIGINSPANVAIYGRRDVRSLRDTFASKLRKGDPTRGIKGLSLDRLQPLLGHASMHQTMKYADLGVEQASTEAVTVLDLLNQ